MDKTVILIIILKIVAIMAVLGIVAFGVYTFVKYGNKPITEIPVWAVFMFGRR